MNKQSIHFPGLNGIRAIAAIIVVVFHTDQWSHYFGLPSIGFWKTGMHSYAVVLFFVLSGFLITYLLMTEKVNYGKVDFRKFYIRRILRIWPVYYLVLFVGTFLLIAFHFWTGRNLFQIFLFHFFLIPNIVFSFGFKAELIGILWSVGAEEQFYAFWPFLINKSKNVIRTLLIFIGIYLIIKWVLVTYVTSIQFGTHLQFVPFHLMAVGGVAAWLYFTNSKLLRVIYHPLVQIFAWIFLIFSVIVHPAHFPFLMMFDRTYHAVMYAIIILNVSTNPKTIITLENKVFNYLGRISYGIYAYHFILLFLLSLGFRKILPYIHFNWLKEAIMFTSVLGFTIIVSRLSFNYFEKWFLSQKEKFAKVKT